MTLKEKSGTEKTGGRWVPMGLAVISAVLVIDQLTKWFVFERILRTTGAPMPLRDWLLTRTPPEGGFGMAEVLPFFNLTAVWNKGVSFGLFSGEGTAIILSFLALGVSSALFYWLCLCKDRLMALALALVIGGAVGNVFDRLRFGAVADFADFYIGRWHWPAFNVADSCIVIGASIMMLDAFLNKKGET